MKASTARRIFPGNPKYRGPTEGYFTLLHRKGPLVEWTNDVMERIALIKQRKPPHEIPIHLRHIIFVPPGLLPWTVQRAHRAMRSTKFLREKAEIRLQKARFRWMAADRHWKEGAYFKDGVLQKLDVAFDKANAAWEKANAGWEKAIVALGRAECTLQQQQKDVDTLLSYLRRHVKDCKWNGHEIVFVQ